MLFESRLIYLGENPENYPQKVTERDVKEKENIFESAEDKWEDAWEKFTDFKEDQEEAMQDKVEEFGDKLDKDVENTEDLKNALMGTLTNEDVSKFLSESGDQRADSYNKYADFVKTGNPLDGETFKKVAADFGIDVDQEKGGLTKAGVYMKFEEIGNEAKSKIA